MKIARRSLKSYNRFVRFLRTTMLVVAILMGGTLFLWPQIYRYYQFFDSMAEKASLSDSKASIDMTSVTYFSEDKKGQPFKITSDSVLETDIKNKIVRLENPKAEMHLNSGLIVYGVSPYGLFYENDEKLHLEDTVTLTLSDGHVMDTSDVWIDSLKKTIQTPQNTTSNGPKMSSVSQGFIIFDNGDKMDLWGKSEVVFKNADVTKETTIRSEGGMGVRQTDKQSFAKKNAVLIQNDRKIFADKLLANFKETDGKNQYELTTAEAVENVHISTLDENIYGQYGFYDADKQEAYVEGNVKIERPSGIVYGDKAIVNMQTGESRLVTKSLSDGQKKRLRGVLYPANLKQKDEK